MFKCIQLYSFIPLLLRNLECVCDEQGSANLSCNSNGTCTCIENAIGEKCDFCESGYFPLPACDKGEIKIRFFKHYYI